MRLLDSNELSLVAGGTGVCTPENSDGTNIYGVKDSEKVGTDLINIYEGLVSATSHVIERVANSL